MTQFFPRWVVTVATAIHYYEAVLASLAIIVWHSYHFIFDSDVFPLNIACLDGRVSAEFPAHEHLLERLQSERYINPPSDFECDKRS